MSRTTRWENHRFSHLIGRDGRKQDVMKIRDDQGVKHPRGSVRYTTCFTVKDWMRLCVFSLTHARCSRLWHTHARGAGGHTACFWYNTVNGMFSVKPTQQMWKILLTAADKPRVSLPPLPASTSHCSIRRVWESEEPNTGTSSDSVPKFVRTQRWTDEIQWSEVKGHDDLIQVSLLHQ